MYSTVLEVVGHASGLELVVLRLIMKQTQPSNILLIRHRFTTKGQSDIPIRIPHCNPPRSDVLPSTLWQCNLLHTCLQKSLVKHTWNDIADVGSYINLN